MHTQFHLCVGKDCFWLFCQRCLVPQRNVIIILWLDLFLVYMAHFWQSQYYIYNVHCTVYHDFSFALNWYIPTHAYMCMCVCVFIIIVLFLVMAVRGVQNILAVLQQLSSVSYGGVPSLLYLF